MTKLRIALSVLALSLTLVACAADDPSLAGPADDDPVADPAPPGADGIGTSPSGPLASCELPADGSALQCKVSHAGARASHLQPCGLWWSPGATALADARHNAAPTDPDMAQVALPGGLSCSALIAALPGVVASQGGAAVVYYVNAPALTEKPVKPWTRWCAWPVGCTDPNAACCQQTCTAMPDGSTICSGD